MKVYRIPVLASAHRGHLRRSKLSPLASNNGSAAEVTSLQESSHPDHAKEGASTIEMYIASTDGLHENGSDPPAGLRRSLSMRVAPPRSAPPQRITMTSEGELSKADSQSTEVRSLKNELGMITAELREAAVDLKENQRKLRAREGEIILLKAALAGRDINLRNSKAELSEAQSTLKQKDSDLQEVYQQLMSNAQERGDVRRQLLQTQAELTQARSELSSWTQNAGDPDEAAESKARAQGQAEMEKKVSANCQGQADLGSGHSADRQEDAEQPNPVADLMDSLSNFSAQLAKDAAADEQAFKL